MLGFGIGPVFRLASVPLNRLWGTIVAAIPVAVWIVLLLRSPASAPVWAGTGLMIAVLVTRPVERWWQRHHPANESKR